MTRQCHRHYHHVELCLYIYLVGGTADTEEVDVGGAVVRGAVDVDTTNVEVAGRRNFVQIIVIRVICSHFRVTA